MHDVPRNRRIYSSDWDPLLAKKWFQQRHILEQILTFSWIVTRNGENDSHSIFEIRLTTRFDNKARPGQSGIERRQDAMKINAWLSTIGTSFNKPLHIVVNNSIVIQSTLGNCSEQLPRDPLQSARGGQRSALIWTLIVRNSGGSRHGFPENPGISKLQIGSKWGAQFHFLRNMFPRDGFPESTTARSIFSPSRLNNAEQCLNHCSRSLLATLLIRKIEQIRRRSR
jgi:hypothetical protein